MNRATEKYSASDLLTDFPYVGSPHKARSNELVAA
jgi:hypothetical protein